MLGLIAVGVIFVAIVVVRQLIPSGLGGIQQVVPFLFFSESRGDFVSPSGDITLTVYTNDAGAGHSGLFPTWVIRKHWYGDEVVARGYLEDSQGPVPLAWTGPRTVNIRFVKGRYDDTPYPQTVTLR